MSKTCTGAELNPTAEVRADVGVIIVSVGDGHYEVYIDQKMQQPALNYNLTHEYPAEPGEHRVGVYSAGRFVLDKMITVPAKEPEIQDEPAEQPAGEPEKTIPVRVDVLRGLFAQLMDAAACLEALLSKEPE